MCMRFDLFLYDSIDICVSSIYLFGLIDVSASSIYFCTVGFIFVRLD